MGVPFSLNDHDMLITILERVNAIPELKSTLDDVVETQNKHNARITRNETKLWVVFIVLTACLYGVLRLVFGV